MAKTNKPKDPKKVAAGKARAAKSVRIDGKFTTNFFKDKIKGDAEAVGFRGDLQKFFDENDAEYSILYEQGKLRSVVDKSDTAIFKDAENYTGKIYANGEEITTHELRYKVLQLEQFLFTNTNCAGVALRPELSFSGKMLFEFPDLEELEDMEDEQIAEYLFDLGIKVWLSSPKDKKKKDKIDRRADKVNTMLNELKPKRAKSRTKPRRR